MAVVWLPTPGNLSHQMSADFAASRGFRLPSRAQIGAVLNGAPIFNEDIWTPTCEHDNAWVSVGNYDPAARLGRLHEESCGGPPGWGPTTSTLSYRKWLAVVVPGVWEWVGVPGTLSHAQAVAFASSKQARLPSKAELDVHLKERGSVPLFPQDVWTPVTDHGNAWVSVGNYVSTLAIAHTRPTQPIPPLTFASPSPSPLSPPPHRTPRTASAGCTRSPAVAPLAGGRLLTLAAIAASWPLSGSGAGGGGWRGERGRAQGHKDLQEHESKHHGRDEKKKRLTAGRVEKKMNSTKELKAALKY